MRVFFYVDDTTTTCIEEQLDTVNAWTRSSVAHSNFLNIATLQEGILLCMSCEALVKMCSRSCNTTGTGSLCAVVKSTRNTIVAGGEDMLSRRDKNTSHFPAYARTA
jgi:hypothetical protein